MFNFFSSKNKKYNRNLIYNLISYEDARNMINDNGNVLIDVRTKKEYDLMHIINSINIPVEKIRSCEEEYKNADKIMVYCSSGLRTKEAIRILNSMGYTNIAIWEYGALSNFPYKDMIRV